MTTIDVRYTGQSFELTIPLHGPESIAGRFHAAHHRRFTYASESEPVEIVNLRLKATGRTAKPEFIREPEGDLNPRAAQIGYKQVYFAADSTSTAARPMRARTAERML